jgi:hypothetical protein
MYQGKPFIIDVPKEAVLNKLKKWKITATNDRFPFICRCASNGYAS